MQCGKTLYIRYISLCDTQPLNTLIWIRFQIWWTTRWKVPCLENFLLIFFTKISLEKTPFTTWN